MLFRTVPGSWFKKKKRIIHNIIMVQELLVQMDFLKFISQITELDQRDEGWLTLFFRAK